VGVAVIKSEHEHARSDAAQRAGEQGLLFDDELAPLPEDIGYRGPTA